MVQDASAPSEVASRDRIHGDAPTCDALGVPFQGLTKGGPTGSFRYVNRVYQNKALTASDHYMQVAELPIG